MPAYAAFLRVVGLIAVLSTLALPFDASAGPTARFATHSRLTTREVRAIVQTADFRITLTVALPHTDPRFNALILLKDSPQLAAEVAIQVRPSAAATRAFISTVETTAPPDPPGNPLGHQIDVHRYIQVCNVFVDAPSPSLFSPSAQLTNAQQNALRETLDVIYGFQSKIAAALRRHCASTT